LPKISKKRCLFGWGGIERRKISTEKKQKGKRTDPMRKTKTKRKNTPRGAGWAVFGVK
jgi:hypothetical protein